MQILRSPLPSSARAATIRLHRARRRHRFRGGADDRGDDGRGRPARVRGRFVVRARLGRIRHPERTSTRVAAIWRRRYGGGAPRQANAAAWWRCRRVTGVPWCTGDPARPVAEQRGLCNRSGTGLLPPSWALRQGHGHLLSLACRYHDRGAPVDVRVVPPIGALRVAGGDTGALRATDRRTGGDEPFHSFPAQRLVGGQRLRW